MSEVNAERIGINVTDPEKYFRRTINIVRNMNEYQLTLATISSCWVASTEQGSLPAVEASPTILPLPLSLSYFTAINLPFGSSKTAKIRVGSLGCWVIQDGLLPTLVLATKVRDLDDGSKSKVYKLSVYDATSIL